jgi:hypothetical protein
MTEHALRAIQVLRAVSRALEGIADAVQTAAFGDATPTDSTSASREAEADEVLRQLTEALREAWNRDRYCEVILAVNDPNVSGQGLDVMVKRSSGDCLIVARKVTRYLTGGLLRAVDEIERRNAETGVM